MTKRRRVTVADLVDRPGTVERDGRTFIAPWPFLYCTKCGAEYSAHAGDYFAHSPDHVFRCCRRNMLLVTEKIVLQEVEA